MTKLHFMVSLYSIESQIKELELEARTAIRDKSIFYLRPQLEPIQEDFDDLLRERNKSSRAANKIAERLNCLDEYIESLENDDVPVLNVSYRGYSRG